MSAIILDGGLKSALAAVRSLGRARIHTSVGAEYSSGMALHSRYVRHRFTYPSPYTDFAGFVRAVRAEGVRMGEKPIVYAFSDATYLSLYRAREELMDDVTLVFPEERSIEIAFDKGATYSLAKVSNVPTIPTHMLTHESEIERILPALTFPCVMKPRKSVSWKDGVGIFGSAVFIHTATDLKNHFRESLLRYGEAPLIQTRMSGDEYGVEMVARAGEAMATVVHHRLRSLSPTGGASVLKEILAPGTLHDMLVTYATTLVRALMWEGPIMVEFKVDSDTRTPKLMEINGRFWGSLPLSVAAGVDMPLVYYKLVRGESTDGMQTTPKEGVVTRHLLGDLRHLARVWFDRDPMRSYTYPKRKDALDAFIHIPRCTISDVWLLSDPLPQVYEIIDMIKKLWK